MVSEITVIFCYQNRLQGHVGHMTILRLHTYTLGMSKHAPDYAVPIGTAQS